MHSGKERTGADEDMHTPGLVAAIIVNWNNWPDTIACLASLRRLRWPRLVVVLVDNGSDDDSQARIRQWLAGEIDALPDRNLRPGALVRNCPDRPHFAVLQPDEPWPDHLDESGAVALVPAGENRGYAAGVNVGLRLAARLAPDYFWLLNNDTVVSPGALRSLVAAMVPETLVAGGLALQAETGRIQALGARFLRPIGKHLHRGEGLAPNRRTLDELASGRFDYVPGASMLVRRELVERAGEMNEEYFLYCEEIDWMDAADAGGRMTLAPTSVVWHVEGASAVRRSEAQSLVSAYHSLRSRLLFTRNRNPAWLPSFLAALAGKCLLFAVRGQWRKAALFFRVLPALWDGRRRCNF